MLRFTENLPPGPSGANPPKAQLLHMERRVLEVRGPDRKGGRGRERARSIIDRPTVLTRLTPLLLHTRVQVLGFAFARPTAADWLDVLLGLGDGSSTPTASHKSTRTRGRAPPSQPWQPSAAAGAVWSGGSQQQHQQQQQLLQAQGQALAAIPLLHARARYLAERVLFDGALVARCVYVRIYTVVRAWAGMGWW